MAVVKAKPTSPGRRFQVKVVNKELHKGAPHKALIENQRMQRRSKRAQRGGGVEESTTLVCRGYDKHTHVQLRRAIHSGAIALIKEVVVEIHALENSRIDRIKNDLKGTVG